jgi:hypothetical protein
MGAATRSAADRPKQIELFLPTAEGVGSCSHTKPTMPSRTAISPHRTVTTTCLAAPISRGAVR